MSPTFPCPTFARVSTFIARFNWVLIFVGVMALTRGVLYTLPTGERLPLVLNLLPRWALVLFGVTWFFTGVYAVYQGFSDTLQHIARWAVGAISSAWGAIYLVATFLDHLNVFTFGITAIFYSCVAGVAFSCKPKVKWKTIFVIPALDGDGKEMIELTDGDDNAT